VSEEQRNKDVLASASRVGQQADTKIICNEDMDFSVKACKMSDGNISVTIENTGKETIYYFIVNGQRMDKLTRTDMISKFIIAPSENGVEIISVIRVNGEYSDCSKEAFVAKEFGMC